MDLAAYMAEHGIHAIKAWPVGRITVELHDGRFGVGIGFAEALEEANKPDATNIRKAA